MSVGIYNVKFVTIMCKFHFVCYVPSYRVVFKYDYHKRTKLKMNIYRFVTFAMLYILSFCIKLIHNRRSIIFREKYGPTGHTFTHSEMFTRESSPSKKPTYYSTIS